MSSAHQPNCVHVAPSNFSAASIIGSVTIFLTLPGNYKLGSEAMIVGGNTVCIIGKDQAGYFLVQDPAPAQRQLHIISVNDASLGLANLTVQGTAGSAGAVGVQVRDDEG